MGNAAPRMRHEATAAPGKCPKNAVGAAVPAGHVAAARKQGEKVAARPGRRGVEQQAGGGGGGGAATSVTVKVVVTRKEAEKLIARLNEQSARDRKARMAELKGQLRAGDGGCNGAAASPASWRDARTPRLAPIQEN